MQCKRKHAENAFLKYVYSVMKFTLFRILLLSSKLQRKLHGIFHKSCALAPISLPVSLIDLLPGSRVSVIFVTSTFVRRNLKFWEKCTVLFSSGTSCVFELPLHRDICYINYVSEFAEGLKVFNCECVYVYRTRRLSFAII